MDKHVRTAPEFQFQEPSGVLVTDPGDKPFSFQYICIKETLSSILGDPTFKPASTSTDGMLRDLKDGVIYKNNIFFQENPDAKTIILYSDALELGNPLGATKGKNKIVNIYLTLGEIPKHLRSKTENWFLVLSVRESDLKLHREEVYAQLLQDLTDLEEEGVCINGQWIKAGLLAHIGDNLEAHTIGGFSLNFASKDVCRICHIQYKDLQCLDGVPKEKRWEPEVYDTICDGLESEHGLPHGVDGHGLRERCLFNKLQVRDVRF